MYSTEEELEIALGTLLNGIVGKNRGLWTSHLKHNTSVKALMQAWYPTSYVKGIFGSVEFFHLKEISSLPAKQEAI